VSTAEILLKKLERNRDDREKNVKNEVESPRKNTKKGIDLPRKSERRESDLKIMPTSEL